MAYSRSSSEYDTGYLWLNMNTFNSLRYFTNFTLWLMIMVNTLKYCEDLRQPLKAININGNGVEIFV